jgi:hypothetical protein
MLNPYGDNCGCYDSGLTPKYFTLIVADVVSCPTKPDCNGTFTLTQVGGAFPCLYRYTSGAGITYALYLDTAANATKLGIYVGPGNGYFNWEGGPECQDELGPVSNDFTACGDGGGGEGYDGTCQWCPGDSGAC